METTEQIYAFRAGAGDWLAAVFQLSVTLLSSIHIFILNDARNGMFADGGHYRVIKIKINHRCQEQSIRLGRAEQQKKCVLRLNG